MSCWNMVQHALLKRLKHIYDASIPSLKLHSYQEMRNKIAIRQLKTPMDQSSYGLCYGGANCHINSLLSGTPGQILPYLCMCLGSAGWEYDLSQRVKENRAEA